MKTAILTLICLSAVACFACAASERSLGNAAAPTSATVLELIETTVPPLAPALSLKITSDGKPMSSPLALKSESLPSCKGLRQDSPLQVYDLPLSSGPKSYWITFALEDATGTSRSIAAVLIRNGDGWHIVKEWTADSGPLGEMGFKREKQVLSVPKPGTLARNLHNLTVEGIMHKLDCGCTACQSRTMETSEDETYVWNASSSTLDRSIYEKRYIVQIGEGLMSVARKALGDARLMGRLYRLNPDIKPESLLKEGQAILVERKG